MPAIILTFADHCTGAPSGLPSRRLSKTSKEILPPDARTIVIRHLWGTPRCRHFFNAEELAPSERATASTIFQSGSMARENRDDQSLRQGTNQSRVILSPGTKIDGMGSKAETPKAYRDALLQRTRELREGRGFTQVQMAGFLGINLEAYKKYERRTPLPHHLIAEFCALVNTTEGYFLSGKVPKRTESKADESRGDQSRRGVPAAGRLR
jgi:DNA-binding XRE family transcriptional regulator